MVLKSGGHHAIATLLSQTWRMLMAFIQIRDTRATILPSKSPASLLVRFLATCKLGAHCREELYYITSKYPHAHHASCSFVGCISTLRGKEQDTVMKTDCLGCLRCCSCQAIDYFRSKISSSPCLMWTNIWEPLQGICNISKESTHKLFMPFLWDDFVLEKYHVDLPQLCIGQNIYGKQRDIYATMTHFTAQVCENLRGLTPTKKHVHRSPARNKEFPHCSGQSTDSEKGNTIWILFSLHIEVHI